MTVPNGSRRDFVRKGVYVAPAILTLAAAPGFAKAGSVKPEEPRGGGLNAGGGGHGGNGPGGAGPGPGRGHGAGGNDRPGRGFSPGRVDNGPRRGGGWLGSFLRNLFGRR